MKIDNNVKVLLRFDEIQYGWFLESTLCFKEFGYGQLIICSRLYAKTFMDGHMPWYYSATVSWLPGASVGPVNRVEGFTWNHNNVFCLRYT